MSEAPTADLVRSLDTERPSATLAQQRQPSPDEASSEQVRDEHRTAGPSVVLVLVAAVVCLVAAALIAYVVAQVWDLGTSLPLEGFLD